MAPLSLQTRRRYSETFSTDTQLRRHSTSISNILPKQDLSCTAINMVYNSMEASPTQRINCSEKSEAISIGSTGTAQRHHLEQKNIEVRCNFNDQLLPRPILKPHGNKISDSATSADTTSTCVGDKESLAPVSTSVQHPPTGESVHRLHRQPR